MMNRFVYHALIVDSSPTRTGPLVFVDATLGCVKDSALCQRNGNRITHGKKRADAIRVGQ